jgi:hypothetical protein
VITTYYWDGDWVKLASWNAAYLDSDLSFSIMAWNWEPEYSAFQIRFDNVYAYGDHDLPQGLVDDFEDGVIGPIWDWGGDSCIGSVGETACEAGGVLTFDIAAGAGPSGKHGAEIVTSSPVLHGEFDVQVDFSIDQSYHDTPNTNAQLAVWDEYGGGGAAAAVEIRSGRYASHRSESGDHLLMRQVFTDDLEGKLRITRTRVNGRGRVVESVTGSGSFTVVGQDGDWRTFAFIARRYADGTVDGQWQRVRRVDGNAAETHSEGVVTCFTIVGNRAWLGGYATSGIYSDPPNGVAWRVEDNGQGKADDADRISLQNVARAEGYPASYCARAPGGPVWNEVEAGNITIKK